MKVKRVIKFVALGALLIAGAAGYLYFWQSRPGGTGPAGLPVPAASFSRTWSEKQFLVVGIGDSVTARFGARPNYAYFDRVIANPSDDFEAMRGKCLQRVL